jgi:hypothetical protein
MSAYEYTVEVLAEDGGPEPELRERFATVIAYRLGQLGEATPLTLVDFEIVEVDPAKPAGSGPVAVTVRIPF